MNRTPDELDRPVSSAHSSLEESLSKLEESPSELEATDKSKELILVDGKEKREAVGDKEDPGNKKGSEIFVDSQLKAIRVKEGTLKKKAKEGLSQGKAEEGTSKGKTYCHCKWGAVRDKKVFGNQKSFIWNFLAFFKQVS